MRALELDPQFVRTHFYLGLAYEQRGQYPQALSELETAIQVAGPMPVMLAALGHAHAKMGDKQKAEQLLRELLEPSEGRYVPPLCMAVIYAGLHQKEEMFEWLRKAYNERSSWLFALNVEPIFKEYRSEWRFSELLQRVGLAA